MHAARQKVFCTTKGKEKLSPYSKINPTLQNGKHENEIPEHFMLG